MPMSPPKGLAPQPNRLVFGAIVIEWEPGVARPIAINHAQLNRNCALVTACAVAFRRAGSEHAIVVPGNFEFDGASIPMIFWCLPGFAPTGKHLWAALCHDWLCKHEEILPRPIADGIFVDLLLETNVGWRGLVMAAAVWAYGAMKLLRARRRV